jgi:uncharacterized protein DUF6116
VLTLSPRIRSRGRAGRVASALVAAVRNPIVALISRFAAKLRYPQLFLVTAALFVLDLVIPDVIPFADELLLGLGTLLLAGLKQRKDPGPP